MGGGLPRATGSWSSSPPARRSTPPATTGTSCAWSARPWSAGRWRRRGPSPPWPGRTARTPSWPPTRPRRCAGPVRRWPSSCTTCATSCGPSSSPCRGARCAGRRTDGATRSPTVSSPSRSAPSTTCTGCTPKRPRGRARWSTTAPTTCRPGPRPTGSGPWVTFGHHTNKNPALVLEAWSLLPDPPALIVIGLDADSRAELERRRADLGLDPGVELAPFLPDPQFHAVLAGAGGVVLASDLEGFGLPVVEAMAMGKPVVVGPDPGTAEVAGGHAVTAAGLDGGGVRGRRAAAPRRWALTPSPRPGRTARRSHGNGPRARPGPCSRRCDEPAAAAAAAAVAAGEAAAPAVVAAARRGLPAYVAAERRPVAPDPGDADVRGDRAARTGVGRPPSRRAGRDPRPDHAGRRTGRPRRVRALAAPDGLGAHGARRPRRAAGGRLRRDGRPRPRRPAARPRDQRLLRDQLLAGAPDLPAATAARAAALRGHAAVAGHARHRDELLPLPHRPAAALGDLPRGLPGASRSTASTCRRGPATSASCSPSPGWTSCRSSRSRSTPASPPTGCWSPRPPTRT